MKGIFSILKNVLEILEYKQIVDDIYANNAEF